MPVELNVCSLLSSCADGFWISTSVQVHINASQWSGVQSGPCQLLEAHGFEIRSLHQMPVESSICSLLSPCADGFWISTSGQVHINASKWSGVQFDPWYLLQAYGFKIWLEIWLNQLNNASSAEYLLFAEPMCRWNFYFNIRSGPYQSHLMVWSVIWPIPLTGSPRI